MATTSSPAEAGLSTQDLERIRDTLAAGRKPKVMFTASAGQIAGQVGQIVHLADPADSDDWLIVRFGHDELPFSPHDLTVPPRGRQAKQSTPPKPRQETTMPETASAAASTNAKPTNAKPTETNAPEVTPASNGKPAKTTRTTKPKPPPSLTVTLAYQDGEWTVAAHQGTKTLAKPYLVKPAEALQLVGMVDVPGVQEAVEKLVAAERAEAQQRAESLRAELAELEARLAELPGTS